MNYYKIGNALTRALNQRALDAGEVELDYESALALVINFFNNLDKLPVEVVYTPQDEEDDYAEMLVSGMDPEVVRQLRETAEQVDIPALCWAGEAESIMRVVQAPHMAVMPPAMVKIFERGFGHITYGVKAFARDIKGLTSTAATAILVRAIAHERRHYAQPREMFLHLLEDKGADGAVGDKASINTDLYYKRPEEADAERAACKALIQFIRGL